MAGQHTIQVDIDKVIHGSMTVRDASGEKVGFVRDYSNEAGYLVMGTGPVAPRDLYVPYSAITSIDPREIHLSLSKAVLYGDYSAPPHPKFVLEGDIASTQVSSGYDGSTAEINRVHLEVVRRDLANGMTVYATGGTKLGTVDAIDPQACYIVVKQLSTRKVRLFIPFGLIISVNPELGVFLAVSRKILEKDHMALPEGSVLRVDDFRPAGVDAMVKDQPTKE